MTDSFKQYVATLADGEKSERLNITLFQNEFKEIVHDDMFKNIKLSNNDKNQIDEQLAYFVLQEILWKFVPMNIFYTARHDFTKIVKKSFADYPQLVNDYNFVNNFSIILKRIRNYYKFGRSSVSLNLQKKNHRQILQEQNRKCAICFYRFKDIDIDYYDEIKDKNTLNEDDLIPEGGLSRSPVLDHIIPYFIGGDEEENWQILCGACNLGKWDAITWFSNANWLSIKRPTPDTALSLIMRHMVLCSYRSCYYCGGREYELRIQKKDKNKLIYFDNLIPVCANCIIRSS